MTAEDLVAFEEEVARRFNAGEITAPVHLYSGNEAQMLDIFKDIKSQDWVFCSWRSHYQCLLKGVPPEQVMSEIVAGRSIALCFPEYRVYSSAIVGGSLPIALGVALGIKMNGGTDVVYCFMGDMTAETGIAHECVKYARNHELPIRFIVEDNRVSVCTDTRAVWQQWTVEPDDRYVRRYLYTSKWPHAGAGKRVQF